MPWRDRWIFIFWANNAVGTQSCPTPPGRSAGHSDLTRPWYVRVLDSKGAFYGVLASVNGFSSNLSGIYEFLQRHTKFIAERNIRSFGIAQPRTKRFSRVEIYASLLTIQTVRMGQQFDKFPYRLSRSTNKRNPMCDFSRLSKSCIYV